MASAATAPVLPVLASNDITARALEAGAAYQASEFPLPVRVTPADGSWFGGPGILKYKGSLRLAGRAAPEPPAVPNGAISVITALGATPSVAATVANLGFGTDATFQPTKSTKVAGYPARSFDGEVIAKHQLFVPFTTRVPHAAKYYPDAYQFDHGEVFRIIVASVKGKALVFLIENLALPPDEFPSFLDTAQKMLDTLTFTRHRTAPQLRLRRENPVCSGVITEHWRSRDSCFPSFSSSCGTRRAPRLRVVA